jgi:hypothetical protein
LDFTEKEVSAMTNIGWEFWGLKFSWFLTALISVVLAITTFLTAREAGRMHHVDTMAGDEGEEW